MRRALAASLVAALVLIAWFVAGSSPRAQGPERTRDPRVVSIRASASSLAELRQWDRELDRMVRDRTLRLTSKKVDTLLPGRTHERLQQFYRDVPVFGAAATRELKDGVTLSIFGRLHAGIDIDPVPAVTADQARGAVARAAGREVPASKIPRLVVLPREDGSYVLAYQLQMFSKGDLRMYFVDAKTGGIAWSYSNLQREEGVVGLGTGVLGDSKKVSATLDAGRYYAIDSLRPATIVTFDFKRNPYRTYAFLSDEYTPTLNDVPSTTDNRWTDGSVVDAHVYQGLIYDYYYKRFGRNGYDDDNMTIRTVVHPVDRNSYAELGDGPLGSCFNNAFWNSDLGVIVIGEGLPPGVRAGDGRTYNYQAGAIDTFGHEMTHAVVTYTADLTYWGESGALNEGFADMMATSAEFFYQQAGNGPLKADYLIAEDTDSPADRSLKDPLSIDGAPDHYSLRYRGSGDNGGVHINATIPGHAFYLAIEGGTNRTSGLSVTGVGASNRAQIEKIFYGAYVFLLPSDSTFSTARAATIYAAQQLYGAGSAADRAVTQAWNAVGVF